MKKAHPFGAEVIGAVFWYAMCGVYWAIAENGIRHGIGHWFFFGISIAAAFFGNGHATRAWRLFRDGVPS